MDWQVLLGTHSEMILRRLVFNPSSTPSLPPSLLTFMVAKPTSHPLITCCCPIVKLNG